MGITRGPGRLLFTGQHTGPRFSLVPSPPLGAPGARIPGRADLRPATRGHGLETRRPAAIHRFNPELGPGDASAASWTNRSVVVHFPASGHDPPSSHRPPTPSTPLELTARSRCAADPPARRRPGGRLRAHSTTATVRLEDGREMDEPDAVWPEPRGRARWVERLAARRDVDALDAFGAAPRHPPPRRGCARPTASAPFSAAGSVSSRISSTRPSARPAPTRCAGCWPTRSGWARRSRPA